MADPGGSGITPPNRIALPPLVRMAALSGVEETVSHFLKRGGDPNSVDGDGRSLLHLAASKGHINVCRRLLEVRASLSISDRQGREIIAAAISSGSSEIVLLIQGYLDQYFSERPLACSTESPDPAGSFDALAHDNLPVFPDLKPVDSPLDCQPVHVGESISVVLVLEESDSLLTSSWEAEEDVPLPVGGDDSCQSSAESMHRRITMHRVIDSDGGWSDVEIVLPVLRRGNLLFSTLDEETLSWISRCFRHGELHGWVPSHWLLSASAQIAECDREDFRLRLEMLMGEFGIQVDAEPAWPSNPPDGIEADATDITAEILAFLDDLSPGTRDPLSSYFTDLARLPLLDREEERTLGRRWKLDQDPEGLRGLVEGNLRFVVKEARKFLGLGLDIQDLVSSGNMGLMEAAKRFDPERENRFLTYAAWWIRQGIFHALAEQGRQIRLPQKVAGSVVLLNRILRQMEDELGREPTPEEIAIEGTFSGSDLDRLLAIRQTASATITEDDESSGRIADDQVPFNDPGQEGCIDQEEFQGQIRQVLTGLTEKARGIVIRHFGLAAGEPETLESIGQAMVPSISRERVRQIEERALSRIHDRKRAILAPYLKEIRPYWDQIIPCQCHAMEDEDDPDSI